MKSRVVAFGGQICFFFSFFRRESLFWTKPLSQTIRRVRRRQMYYVNSLDVFVNKAALDEIKSCCPTPNIKSVMNFFFRIIKQCISGTKKREKIMLMILFITYLGMEFKNILFFSLPSHNILS
jgi:hypothetical protein